jgi:hypothetical protein
MRTRFLFALLASLGLALFMVPARAEVPVDDTLLLDPFDPVPEIQFRHFGDNGCWDGCGYERCHEGCGRRCYEGCGYRRCHEGCRSSCRDGCRRDRCERSCWHELGCGDRCWGDRRYGYTEDRDHNERRFRRDHEEFKDDHARFNADADRYEHQSEEYRHRYEDGHSGRAEERAAEHHEEHEIRREERRDGYDGDDDDDGYDGPGGYGGGPGGPSGYDGDPRPPHDGYHGDGPHRDGPHGDDGWMYQPY